MSQPAPDGAPPPGAAPDPRDSVRTRGYLVVLLVAAVVGVPVSAAAYGFLALVHELQDLVFHDLPRGLGFHGTPVWWPVPALALSGALVALTLRYLPGTGGHEPADGMSTKGVSAVSDLPGIVIAAIASLALGVVLGPEAPLIALGGGLALGAVRLTSRDLPDQATRVITGAGSFAAVSALLGSPLLGAFLLMEASGLGGTMLGVVLVPGLLAAGIGALIFTGLGSWTGLGTYSLALHHVPSARTPDAAQFGWALVIGLGAALAGAGVRWVALTIRPHVARRRLPLSVLAGLAVAGLTVAYAQGTGHTISDVLYSGQNSLDPLLEHRAGYTVGALVLLLVCKALAYGVSLSAFRGGPIFPAMFVGAVGGTALSHAGGLPVTAGFAMGIGAMCVAMLGLPMTSVLLATLLLGKPGLTVMPLVIVAVVVSYVLSTRLRLRQETGSPPKRQATSPK
ncbi:chloride channel protein [Streptantibioticus parmotrematis]|uniref:chloride channel protein n=1 Tax=Streptantibioticus parmotrematis TaxID=2873249 RepID=UPI0033FEA1E5